jgi:hypothetical protein
MKLDRRGRGSVLVWLPELPDVTSTIRIAVSLADTIKEAECWLAAAQAYASLLPKSGHDCW